LINEFAFPESQLDEFRQSFDDNCPHKRRYIKVALGACWGIRMNFRKQRKSLAEHNSWNPVQVFARFFSP
jgi:hypothetical protein